MKNANRRPRKNIFKKCGWGGLLSLCNISLIGVGFSSWAINNYDSSVSTNINVYAADVVNLGEYFSLNTNYGDDNLGVTNIKYIADSGLVDLDGEIGKSCNLVYYLKFRSNAYAKAANISNGVSLGFVFKLGYKEYKSGYSLITDGVLSCTISTYSSNSETYNEDDLAARTSSTSVGDHVSTTNSTISLNTSNAYLHFEINYSFSVSDYSTVISNEGSAGTTVFNLNASIGGASA